MKKRTLFKTVIWTLSVAVMLFGVLIVHIATVIKPANYDNNQLQLSRIDFKQNLDPVQAAQIKHFVASLPGVQNVIFNPQQGTLVYGFNTSQQTSANVYKQLMGSGHYKADRFIAAKTDLPAGCPMSTEGRSSFIYKISAQVAKWL